MAGRVEPTQVDDLERFKIVSVACGRYHSAAISGIRSNQV